MDDEFWKAKPLSALTQTEWEALCDGCGICCLIQLEDTETSKRKYTRVACHLLDIGVCRCTSYETRASKVKDCVHITPKLLETADWLPPSCAYRLIHEGKDLEWWHPLISKSRETVHKAGISVRGWALSENDLSKESDLQDYIEHDLPSSNGT